MSVKHTMGCPRFRRGGRECTCGSEPLLYPGWEAEARKEAEAIAAKAAGPLAEAPEGAEAISEDVQPPVRDVTGERER